MDILERAYEFLAEAQRTGSARRELGSSKQYFGPGSEDAPRLLRRNRRMKRRWRKSSPGITSKRSREQIAARFQHRRHTEFDPGDSEIPVAHLRGATAALVSKDPRYDGGFFDGTPQRVARNIRVSQAVRRARGSSYIGTRSKKEYLRQRATLRNRKYRLSKKYGNGDNVSF